MSDSSSNVPKRERFLVRLRRASDGGLFIAAARGATKYMKSREVPDQFKKLLESAREINVLAYEARSGRWFLEELAT